MLRDVRRRLRDLGARREGGSPSTAARSWREVGGRNDIEKPNRPPSPAADEGEARHCVCPARASSSISGRNSRSSCAQ